MSNKPDTDTALIALMPPPPTSSKALSVSSTKSKLAKASPAFLGNDLALIPKKLGDGKKLSAENGASPMDWAKRTSADIPIRRPSTRGVTPDELAKHNKKTDCWIALRGHVYDVTEYLSYHPGGVNEIMKGAGIDGTALFNSIHRYVNFETILLGKQIGVYTRRASIVNEEEDGERALSFISMSMVHRDSVGHQNLGKPKNKCFKICNICNNKDSVAEMIPLTSFTENNSYVTYKVSLQGFKYNKDYWSIALLEKEKLLLKVITKPPDMWMAYFQLTKPVEDDTIKVDFQSRFKKLILRIPKPTGGPWTKLGDPLPDHNEIEDSRRSIEDMVPASIILRETIAHDMYFVTIRVHHSGRIGVPIGFDIKIRIDGVSRRYTPVCPLFHKNWNVEDPDHQLIHLIYKYYVDGSLTPRLTKLPVTSKEDTLLIGASSGNFDTDWLQGVDGLVLLAAGSGITPYFRVLHFLMEHNVALGISHVILLYWNKTENEIVWKNEFEKLEQSRSWFHFVPILTRAEGNNWRGKRGRICPEIMGTCLGSFPKLTGNKQRIRWMCCGSDGFNTSALEAIEGIGHLADSVFVFLG